MAFGFAIPAFLTVLVLVLPWQVVPRLVCLVAIGVALLLRLTPPVHYSDQGWLYIPTSSVLGLLLGMPLVLYAGRIATCAAMGQATALRPSLLDQPIFGMAGMITGLWLFSGLAWSMTGNDHPYMMHAIPLLISVPVVWPYWLAGGILRSFGLGLGGALLCLTIWSLVVFPATVRASAEALAGDRAWCIALQQRGRAAEHWSDLTFLTMDKQRWKRHAILVIAGDPPEDAPHWSYHRRAFMGRGGPLDAWRCIPLAP